MSKEAYLGEILELNGQKLPKQEDFNEFILEPVRDYPFDSRIVTSYLITRVKDNKILQITPENLWKNFAVFTKTFD